MGAIAIAGARRSTDTPAVHPHGVEAMPMRSTLARVVVCTFTPMVCGLAQSWRQASPPASPPARSALAMVTDPTSGVVMCFGGWSGSAYLGDTWIFDGTSWSILSAPGPVARSDHAMAFDESRGVAVLFGGIRGTGVTGILGDTWEWSLAGGWVQRAAALHPPVRFGHAMAYDRSRGRVVMFGGRTVSGTIFLDDTWEWDGTAWLPSVPATKPTPRMHQVMAFDPASNRVLLFGGIQLGGPIVGDTWVWDGTNWMQLAPAAPPAARMQAAMALDTLRGRVVLHGGVDGVAFRDTFEWDGSEWSPVATPAAPNAPVLPAMASGPGGRHLVLFGGQTLAGSPLAETWWYGMLPAIQPFGTGCGTPPLALTAAGAPLLGASFVATTAPVPAGGVCFQSLGFSSQWAGTAQLPIDLTGLGMPGCLLYHDLLSTGLPCALGGNVAQYTVTVPDLPFLAGLVVYLQGFVLAPGVNPAGVLTSNALAVTLGR